jgi:multidrug efflux pump subunit AcrA (membrane-fusion protein)
MRGRKAGVAILLAAGLAVAAYLTWPRAAQPGNLGRKVQRTKVKGADFSITVHTTGLLEASRSAPVISGMPQAGQASMGGPSAGTQIVWCLSEGSWVETGEVVIRLDKTDLEKEISDLEKEKTDAEEKTHTSEAEAQKGLKNAQRGIERAQAAQRQAGLSSRTQLEDAEGEVTFQLQELEVAQGEYNRYKKLADARLIPRKDLEQRAESLADQEFAVETARRGLERAKEEAERTERQRKADIERAELELQQAQERQERSVAFAKEDLERKQQRLEERRGKLGEAELKAPASGLLLLERTWEETAGERPLDVGDRVYEQQQVASVVDPAGMQVRCEIRESDIERVKVGQRAIVQVAALGGVELQGKTASIAYLGREDYRRYRSGAARKAFSALVDLTTREKRLRPGMSATVTIVLEDVKKGLAVPAQAIFPREGEPVVYRAEDGRFREIGVKTGKQNELWVQVQGPIRLGDEVACERPPAAAVISRPGRRQR